MLKEPGRSRHQRTPSPTWGVNRRNADQWHALLSVIFTGERPAPPVQMVDMGSQDEY